MRVARSFVPLVVKNLTLLSLLPVKVQPQVRIIVSVFLSKREVGKVTITDARTLPCFIIVR